MCVHDCSQAQSRTHKRKARSLVVRLIQFETASSLAMTSIKAKIWRVLEPEGGTIPYPWDRVFKSYVVSDSTLRGSLASCKRTGAQLSRARPNVRRVEHQEKESLDIRSEYPDVDPQARAEEGWSWAEKQCEAMRSS